MSETYNQGILGAYGLGSEVINDVSEFAATLFVPEVPLISLLKRKPLGSVTFTWLNSNPRPRTNTVGTGGLADGTTTSLPVADASMYMVGDVLDIAGERLEVMADPNLTVTPNTVTVRRGAEGTTAAAHIAGTAITLIGNSRSGNGEVDQSAIRLVRTAVSQYAQSFLHAVQVSGSAESSTNVVLPSGQTSLFSSSQVEALRNLVRDMEYTSLYGLGEAPSTTNVRPKQKGLKALLSTNKTTSPTNASAYTPADFLRDTVQKCRDGGGNPDVAMVSTGFLSGLAKWGMNVERVQVGTTALGTPITAFLVPFVGQILFYEHQQLGSSTNHSCAMLTSSEVQWRNKRNEFWQPRGLRGDAMEGDYIAEGAIEAVNEAHHAWVEGITAFSN